MRLLALVSKLADATLVRLAAACFALACGASASLAEPRLALIVGNGSYTTLSSLKNPVGDAHLIGDKLRSVNFDVTVLENADKSTMSRGFRDFARKVEEAGKDTIAVVYYAGHGVQDDRQTNYLIPTDADIRSQVELPEAALQLDNILRMLEGAQPKIALLILDACRNNPLPASRSRDLQRGLAVESQRAGVLIAFSTQPGKVALDGTGASSPYAEALAAELATPGIEVEQMFKKVRQRVMETTGGQQLPWDVSQLTTDFFFAAAVAAAPVSENLPQDAKSGAAAHPAGAAPQAFADPDIEYGNAVLEDTVEAYTKLLQSFPQHPKKAFILALIQTKKEEILWKRAEQAKTAADKAHEYERIYLAFPDGAYAARARQRHDALLRETTTEVADNPVVTPPAVADVPAAPRSSAGSFSYVANLDPNGNNWLALRNAPSFQAPWSATHMSPGTLLTVLSRSGEWLQVRLASGEIGWANGKFVACCRGTGAADAATQAGPEKPTAASYHYVDGLDPSGDNWLALRNAPSFQSGWSPTKMGPGTLLSVLGRTGEWLHVRTMSGEVGWANAKYVACCRGSDTRPPPVAASAPAPAESASTIESRYHFVDGLDPNGDNWLALRSGPSFQAGWSATRMPPGTLLSVLDREGEWMRVRLLTGETGWANAQFVKCCH